MTEKEKLLEKLEKEWSEKYPGQPWKKEDLVDSDYAPWPQEKSELRSEMRTLEKEIKKEFDEFLKKAKEDYDKKNSDG